ncbi:MAG: phosphoribosylanthranilate isomerase [Bosea sp. (in: a-proteobacteria)]
MSHPSDSFLIKICGLSTPETMEAALDAGADMVGLVFHRKSPRSVSHATAAALAQQACGRAQSVALVVDCDLDVAAGLAATVKPDWFQLHGGESPALIGQMRQITGARQMKVLGVGARADLARFADYAAIADRMMLDAKAPKDAAYPGGHGKPFDWTILAALGSEKPFILAGGLTPDTVADAITSVRGLGVRLWGVDVSSGVETAPGVKDIGKIKAFVQAARAAATGA